MGVDGFVEQFVPRENWPEPRPVSPDVYRAALESLQQTPGSATVAAEAAADSDEEEAEEDPVRVRRSRRLE